VFVAETPVVAARSVGWVVWGCCGGRGVLGVVVCGGGVGAPAGGDGGGVLWWCRGVVGLVWWCGAVVGGGVSGGVVLGLGAGRAGWVWLCVVAFVVVGACCCVRPVRRVWRGQREGEVGVWGWCLLG